MNLELQRKDEIDPICPHCQSGIKTIWYRGLSGALGRRYIYFCAQCRKVLGISHRKGFWMG